MWNKNVVQNRLTGGSTVICHQRHQRLWRLLAAPVVMFLLGFSYEGTTYFYRNGVSIYNYFERDNPSQIIAFEDGIPAFLGNVTINGIPVDSFQRTVIGGSPVKRGQGRILALTWYYTERYDIRFSVKSIEYRLPLNDFQRLQVFGRPKRVDHTKKPDIKKTEPVPGSNTDPFLAR